ncbi:protein-export chaperone SecB [Fluviibacter phosphoraccumulans]|uniref:Preprotein translocase subunit SecB n=1 Tax=Fluviibacter phosphoraccumulans TaxID=1751046 RepID=A0A7R6QY84_9RHOO|nr:protein-export chaperone SecB [Fluviibacter phosphoraccumulans]BBU69632.1 hypothetical protein ICHIAU1_19150 [Fluviibacter phosphoraccumulans]BBU71185.1 hypothetical protein ICHIJ1_11040 [Fluviibacter phosphoraccumulans]
MKLSPIQLLQSSVQQITVFSVDTEKPELSQPMLSTLDFQVLKEIQLNKQFWDDEPNAGTMKDRTYRVTLGIRTPEDKSFHQYRFEIVLTGVVVSMQEAFPQHSVEDMVFEYGLTLLFGIAREQLATTTARMSNGSCLLPTMNFMGEAAKPL